MTAPGLVPVTTYAIRLRHYAHEDRLHTDRHAPRRRGRGGRTICGQDGFDQDRYDFLRDKGWWRRHVDITTLPPCKKCARKANH